MRSTYTYARRVANRRTDRYSIKTRVEARAIEVADLAAYSAHYNDHFTIASDRLLTRPHIIHASAYTHRGLPLIGRRRITRRNTGDLFSHSHHCTSPSSSESAHPALPPRRCPAHTHAVKASACHQCPTVSQSQQTGHVPYTARYLRPSIRRRFLITLRCSHPPSIVHPHNTPQSSISSFVTPLSSLHACHATRMHFPNSPSHTHTPVCNPSTAAQTPIHPLLDHRTAHRKFNSRRLLSCPLPIRPHIRITHSPPPQLLAVSLWSVPHPHPRSNGVISQQNTVPTYSVVSKRGTHTHETAIVSAHILHYTYSATTTDIMQKMHVCCAACTLQFSLECSKILSLAPHTRSLAPAPPPSTTPISISLLFVGPSRFPATATIIDHHTHTHTPLKSCPLCNNTTSTSSSHHPIRGRTHHRNLHLVHVPVTRQSSWWLTQRAMLPSAAATAVLSVSKPLSLDANMHPSPSPSIHCTLC